MIAQQATTVWIRTAQTPVLSADTAQVCIIYPEHHLDVRNNFGIDTDVTQFAVLFIMIPIKHVAIHSDRKFLMNVKWDKNCCIEISV